MNIRFVFILVFFSFAIIDSEGQPANLKFKHLESKDGLSNRAVSCILKDSKGYLWFGTDNGLNKFDGYKFTVFKNDPSNSRSISGNRITALFEDSEGIIWISTTDEGLNKYDRLKDEFIHYKYDIKNNKGISTNGTTSITEDKNGNLIIGSYWGINKLDKKTGIFENYIHDPNDTSSLIENSVISILEDKNGKIWAGTRTGGLDVLDQERNTFINFQHDTYDLNSLSSNFIRCIFEDSKGNLWLGTDIGLNLFNKDKNNFTRYVHDPGNDNSLSHDKVMAITEDAFGRIWVGTATGGINILDIRTGKFYRNEFFENDPNSISSASIYSLYKDDNDNIWVGTYDAGVNWVDSNEKKFMHFKKIPSNYNSIGNNYILNFEEDENGDIWICTGTGLDVFDFSNKNFYHFSADIPNSNTTSGSFLSGPAMKIDREKNLWIGTWGRGLTKISPDRQNFKRFLHDINNPSSVSSDYFKAITEDLNGDIWIGTSGKGICRYDKINDNFICYEHIPEDSTSLSSNYIGCLLIDSQGKLWIGTEGGGLSIFNVEKNNFIQVQHQNENPESLSNNMIHSIFEDSKNRIWVGTASGLNKYSRNNDSFVTYNEKHGLPGNSIRSIQEDDHGNLWMSTNHGITRFNPEKETFRNFSPEDGLQGLDFHTTSLRSKSGEIYFGSSRGFNVFHPDSIKDNKIIPPVYITKFQIFNKDVEVGKEGSPLKSKISETSEIVLSHLHSVISFEFSALNYSSTGKNQFSYILEGFEKEWNYVGTQRSATYTNLDPGKYTLRVKASNNDGHWNEEGISLALTITPPYWKTWWFRLTMFMLFIGSIYGWYLRRISSINKLKDILEFQVKERTTELLQANDLLLEQKKEIFIQRNKLESLYIDIKDSIRAAENLQQSILPSLNMIHQHLPESFVFFKPKDVVSGDFYWFHEIEDNVLIAAVDCTGHGMSGAMMSINGFHLLNNSVHSTKTLKASAILDRINDGIIKGRLHNSNVDVQNGMEMALCVLNKPTRKLQYAGAVNPLYVFRKGEIIQIKGDGFPIGLTLNSLNNNISRKYTNHEMELQDGDMVYIFSDGYADQIGGIGGDKKFMYPRFRELLLRIGDKPISNQIASLESSIIQWKGENDQLDDILVIGFRI